MALEDLAEIAGRPRQHRALPVRRQPDRQTDGGDGRADGNRVHADHARRDAGDVLRGGEFPIGGSKVLRESNDDVVTVVAAGITVGEALRRTIGCGMKASTSGWSMPTR